MTARSFREIRKLRTWVELSDFPEKISATEPVKVVAANDPTNPTLESIEKAYIHFVLSQTDGRKAKAAKILGIGARTLYRKLKDYGVT